MPACVQVCVHILLRICARMHVFTVQAHNANTDCSEVIHILNV